VERILSGNKAKLPSVIEGAVYGADVIHMDHGAFGAWINGSRIIAHAIQNYAGAFRISAFNAFYIISVIEHIVSSS
jgi:uncharacterized protein involved in tellurium resistance